MSSEEWTFDFDPTAVVPEPVVAAAGNGIDFEGRNFAGAVKKVGGGPDQIAISFHNGISLVIGSDPSDDQQVIVNVYHPDKEATVRGSGVVADDPNLGKGGHGVVFYLRS